MRDVLGEIYKAGLKFLAPLSLGETYTHIVEEAKKLCQADYGSIFLYQDDQLRRVYTTFPLLRQVKLRSKGFTYNAFKKRQFIIVDASTQKNMNPKIKQMGIKSDMLIPLFYRKTKLGVLSLLSLKIAHFTREHLDTLKLFTAIATLAILKAKSYDETKNALDERDLFISMAAHELRTPLTTINGYIQMLHSKLSGADTSESRWIGELLLETERLNKLVDELLTVGRIKAGVLQYTFKECSLQAIIKRAVADTHFTYPDHKVIFGNKLEDGQDLVIGDFDKLLQALINLLDNAAKFSPPGSEIFVSLKRKSLFLILTISDQGPGIAKKDLSFIFDRFYKAQNVSKEGIGLGLYLAKNIIQAHRGTIKISTRKNKGTTVEVRLPRVKALMINP